MIASCQEVIEYQKGQKQLKTTTIEIADAEIEKSKYVRQTDKIMQKIRGLWKI